MGREAECICKWNNLQANVKALLEPPNLVLRGEIRRKIPLTEIEQIHVDGNDLCFTFQDESVALTLGPNNATRWAQALLKPPPTLARKLGISSETVVRMIGSVDDDSLRIALSEGKEVSSQNADLILARINSPTDFASALKSSAKQLDLGVPIWFIYRKGPGHPLNESFVRSTALAAGIVDTKVASISPALTALRFVKRRT